MARKVKTRLFAPTESQTDAPVPMNSEPLLAPAPIKRQRGRGMTAQSRILLILAVFITAAMCVVGLRGSAEISSIYIKIGEMENAIAKYTEDLSQIIKEQSALHGYNAIYDANRAAGRVLFWDD